MASPKNKRNYINRLPPLGILYLASYLERFGYCVDIVDCNVDELKLECLNKYDLVGFSINVSNIENSVNLIKVINQKNYKIPLVIGGPLPTVSAQSFFHLPVSAIFVSESENSLLDYIKNPQAQEAKGYYFKNKHNEWVFNGCYPYIEDLDNLPFPALEKLNLKKYYTPIKKTSPVSILISSRGCPFACTFCGKILGDKFRWRSPENVVAEIEWQVNKISAKEIAIYDDNFTLINERVDRFCDLIIRKGIKVKLQLTNGVRVDNLSYDLLSKMKRAGFWIIAVAPESGNPITLKQIKKEFELSRVKQCVAWCRKLNIKVWAFFMIGFPWENIDMINDTINFAIKLGADLTHFSIVTPFPKTELYTQIFGSDQTKVYLEDISLFHSRRNPCSNFSSKEIGNILRKAYVRVYVRTSQILNLLSFLSFKDFLRMSWYATRIVF